MGNNHGGARPGAGRKPKSVKHRRQVNAFEKAAAGEWQALFNWMLDRAQGSVQRTVKRIPRALVMRSAGRGEMVQVFPDHPEPDELITVEETEVILPPSEKAIAYLVDRFMGRPAVEATVDGEVDEKEGRVTFRFSVGGGDPGADVE